MCDEGSAREERRGERERETSEKCYCMNSLGMRLTVPVKEIAKVYKRGVLIWK